MRERMVGNFPQAFSHLALISAAVTLGSASTCSRTSSCCRRRRCAAGHRDPAGRRGDGRAEPVRRVDLRPRRDAPGPQRRRPVPPRALGDHRRPDPMYASPEARDADIVEGARRPAAEQVPTWSPLPPGSPSSRPRWRAPARSGRWRCVAAGWCAGRDLPTLRLREVVLHHVDLDTGFTLADADAGFVERTLRRAVATLAAARRPRRCGSAATRATCGRSATGRRTSPAAGGACCCGSPGAARTRSRPRVAAGAAWPGADPPGSAVAQVPADSRLTPALRASATAPSAEWTLSLDRMLCTCVRTVFGETLSSSPICVREARPSGRTARRAHGW